MDRELILDYPQSRNMPEDQSVALANVLAQFVTKSDLDALKADLTWRMIAMCSFFAVVMTLLDVFVD